jgi:hypothetical protein
MELHKRTRRLSARRSFLKAKKRDFTLYRGRFRVLQNSLDFRTALSVSAQDIENISHDGNHNIATG